MTIAIKLNHHKYSFLTSNNTLQIRKQFLESASHLIEQVKSAGWRSCEWGAGNRGERAGRFLRDIATFLLSQVMSSGPDRARDLEVREGMEEGMDSEEEEDPEDLGDEEEEEDDMDSDEEAEDPSLKEKIAWVDIEFQQYSVWLLYVLHIGEREHCRSGSGKLLILTTGLDVDQDTIMEVAMVVTNSLLNVLAESPNLVLKVEDKLISNMRQPYQDQHTKGASH
ncbi:Oligoribonuclease, mitochondrial [Portunus trituberculatus]|uniref:Oligoribonuclease, mitochondrial n=1 Tax=Portunus trituberculatus TaxID=210409 RepID=A0A5B7D1X3_PORTR|nr:Oligoribonuclease, mitochondrial [Portunus trituberculatus]